MPTAKARKASTTSGTRPRSTACSGDAAAAFRLAYGVTDSGNWEGKTVLNRLHQPGLLTAEEEARLRASRAILLEARACRPPPARDDKVLADWNGLMIAALARASVVFGRADWLERAARAFAFITGEMTSADHLAHSSRAGRSLELAFLDDYAFMAAAALALFESTAEDGYLRQAERWIDRLDADYLDHDQGGYFQVSASATDVLVRAKSAQDGPTPAGNGTLLSVLGRLFCLTGQRRHRDRAEQILRAFSGEALRNPTVHASLLRGTLMLERPVQIVVLGDPAEPACAALRRVALAAALPAGAVLSLTPAQNLPDGHPAIGKGQVGGRPTAYVCPGQTCRLPITDPDELAAALAPASIRQNLEAPAAAAR